MLVAFFLAGAVTPVKLFSNEPPLQKPAVDSYNLRAVQWTKSVNCDAIGNTPIADTYVRNCWLYFWVDYWGSSMGLTKTLYSKIFYRRHGFPSYTLYVQGDDFNVVSYYYSLSPAKVIIGWPNPPVPHGLWDFRIEIYEKGAASETNLDELDAVSQSGLLNRPFEHQSEDPIPVPMVYTGGYCNYVISEAQFTTSDDGDGDGFAWSRTLKVDVDVLAEDVSRQIYAKIYYTNDNSPDPSYTNLYCTSGPFTVKGTQNANDAFYLTIGSPNPQLDHDQYFFKVEIWEPGGTEWEAFHSAPDNPALIALFENASQDGKAGISADHASDMVKDFVLRQNYPNPFNASTVIQYGLKRPGKVRLSVMDLAGKTIRILADGMGSEGENRTEWNGTDASGNPVPSGIYFYRLETETETTMRKMVLQK